MATENNNIKKAMLGALKKTFGRVSMAADMVGINRCTHYKWLEQDSEYKEAFEDINESAIDFVESKLFEKINGVSVQKETMVGPEVYELPPSDTAIIFYLKTKGKKRGYVERNEVEHSGNGVSLNIIMPEGE